MFNLVLAHCPKELQEQLKMLAAWDSTSAAQDLMSLLVMICNLAHQHDKTKQGTMALVQQHLELAFMTHEPGMSWMSFCSF